MRKFMSHCAAVLSRMIIIGFGVQIVLGAIWMCNAFAGLRGFGEGIVCVGKILFFLCAAFCFLRAIRGVSRGAAAFGSVAITMFPMVLQTHFAAGRQSVTASFLLFAAAGILLAPRAKGMKKWLWICGTVIAVALCATVGAGDRNREKCSILECISSRFAWTTLMDTYAQMPEEWRDMLSWNKVLDSSYEAAGMEQVLFPYLKETLGEEQTEAFLKEMVRNAWEENSRRIVKEMTWDMAGYTLAPVVLPLQLKGRAYDSYSGLNYCQILIPAPKCGKIYMDYGCWWFQISLAASLILWIVKYADGFRISNKVGLSLIFLSCGCMAAFYTMSGAGKMDYKNTTFILCMWLAGILSAAIQDGKMPGGKQDEKDNSILAGTVDPADMRGPASGGDQ